MHTCSSAADCRRAVAAARQAGRKIGFVPTMGGLHVGHASLIRRSKQAGDFVVTSLYVNPTQFGPGEDYSAYPRTLEADSGICAEAGGDLLWTPTPHDMYDADDDIRVQPGRLASGLCGPFRPGHFEGVCTVVAKLFHIVQPDAAYFGQKDAQQAAIIRKMVSDLRFQIDIVVCPIIREPDGLACSTRNQYLTPEQRQQSASLFRSLDCGRVLIAKGERRTGRIVFQMRRVLDAAGPCKVDYIAVVDPETLEDVSIVDRPVLLALAVRIGSARLIDNLVAEPPGDSG